MKNIKKYGVLILTVAIMLMMLTACGEKEENEENKSSESTVNVQNTETQNSETASNVQNTTNVTNTTNTQTSNVVIPTDYTVFTDSTTGLKFAYPSTWVNAGTDQIPVFGDSTTGATVNLVTENTLAGMSLSTYVEASKTAVKSAFDIDEEIKEENIKVNGTDAVQLTYSTTQSNIEMTLQQVLMVKDNKAYVLTFGAPTIYYNSSKDTFSKILSTVQL